jgi:hypothetical protein
VCRVQPVGTSPGQRFVTSLGAVCAEGHETCAPAHIVLEIDQAGVKRLSRASPMASWTTITPSNRSTFQERTNLCIPSNFKSLGSGMVRYSTFWMDLPARWIQSRSQGDKGSATVFGLAIVAGGLRQVVTSKQLVERVMDVSMFQPPGQAQTTKCFDTRREMMP